MSTRGLYRSFIFNSNIICFQLTNCVNIDRDQYVDLIDIKFDENAFLSRVNDEQMRKRDKSRMNAAAVSKKKWSISLFLH